MMRRRLVWFAAIAVCCAGSALAEGELASLSTSSLRNLEPSDYVIGAQDTLIVTVFDVPELSQTIQVDNSGYIVFPLIGSVDASGLTSDQLSRKIAEALNQKYLKNPIVSVSVKDPVSQKITVDGSVVQPGVYQIGPHTTLIDAVSLARGPDTVADEHQVEIVRNDGQKQVISTFDLADIRDGKSADPIVYANDLIVVGISGSRRFVRDFGNLFATLSLMRP